MFLSHYGMLSLITRPVKIVENVQKVRYPERGIVKSTLLIVCFPSFVFAFAFNFVVDELDRHDHSAKGWLD